MFGLSIEDLRTESRSRDIALPRQIAMYLAKQLTDASLSEIGRQFGGKHDTTVMHSIAKIHELRATDAGMNTLIETLLGNPSPRSRSFPPQAFSSGIRFRYCRYTIVLLTAQRDLGQQRLGDDEVSAQSGV
jgi:hypothetical protein